MKLRKIDNWNLKRIKYINNKRELNNLKSKYVI